MIREIEPDEFAPLILGVDPARFGRDKTAFQFRRGRDARSITIESMAKKDNMAVANYVAKLIDDYNPDAVCIDAGAGSGIIDRLREMGYIIHEVWFGGESLEPEWGNLRTYMWAQVRDWLPGGMVPDDEDLKTDLVTPEYKMLGRTDKTVLESKEEMHARGFSSPDRADALALTFAKPNVARKDRHTARGMKAGRFHVAGGTHNYNPHR